MSINTAANTSNDSKEKVLYFSGLNGLRAIAALSVVFSHASSDFILFGLDPIYFSKYADGSPKLFNMAAYGVTIFFTLSGFLITYLLLEENKKQPINIRNFYIRRILRIWPLYYTYLIIAIITMLITGYDVEGKAVLFYVFLMANVPFFLGIGDGLKLIGHYGSLGVEEQFYSFWPWVVKKSKSVLTTTLIICCSFMLLKTLIRIYDIYQNGGNMSIAYIVFNTNRFDCMLIGAIGAILLFQENVYFLKLTNNKIAQFFSWFVIFLVVINQFHFISFLDNEFISIVTVFIILGQIKQSNRLINLEAPFLNFLGKISYGIYVIHPLIIFYLSRFMQFSDKSNMVSHIIVYCCVFFTTIAVAYLSYEYWEKPFLVMKDKFTVVKSSASKNH
jgi:peptidoglycan/LPS O-acetylase OafA/YrhL